ncbi:MAG: WecB/TagA/CpsF family glycosyltransferase [Planctomycetaceae bacterium]
MSQRARLDRVEVLGFPVDLVDREALVARGREAMRLGRPFHMVALNALKTLAALEDAELARIVREAELVYPDGVGIVWALRRLHGVRVKAMPGCDLMEEFLAIADREGLRVHLVGGSSEVAGRMARIVRERLPGALLTGSSEGYFTGAGWVAAVAAAVEARADLLLVAMGAGRQERFIRDVAAAGGRSLMMGVGGSFDVYAGAVRRAPPWVRSLRLEWLYRAMRQPSRIPRILRLPGFVRQVLRAQRR